MTGGGAARGALLPILTYHFLRGPDRGCSLSPEEERYAVEIDLFREHLGFLVGQGYRAITLCDLLRAYSGETSLPERPIVLTFDDGHRSVADLALKTLHEYEMTATCFVITGRVGEPEYLSWAQVLELADAGIEIGSHGETHRSLTCLDRECLASELERSRDALGERIECPYAHLALPFGFRNPRVLKAARDAYDTVCTSDFGLNDLGSQPRTLRRIDVKARGSVAELAAALDRGSFTHRRRWARDVMSRLPKALLYHRRKNYGQPPDSS